MSLMLTPDAQVPALSVETLTHGTWSLADQSPDNFTMVVFYRGLHCPACKAYLQKMQGLLKGYAEAGFSTIAISMDPKDRAAQSASEWELPDLTVGYGLSEANARAWGLYISKAFKDGENDVFCEPGMFWIRPDGRLYMVDVSNMPWPRPDLEFLLSKVPFAVENKYPARGGHTD